MPAVAAIILGVVLGITEFLPVSSLGHSLILATLLNFPPTAAGRDTIALFIQGGAVLAVVVNYAPDLFRQARQFSSDPKVRRLWGNLIVAFIPIGILGFIFNNQIKKYLFTPVVIGAALIVGGIVFLVIENRKQEPRVRNLEDVTLREALIVGVAQIFALIPGVSRSGATIVGGLLGGLDRAVATTFTFYLFIPTLGAAAGYELFKAYREQRLDPTLTPYYILATLVAFMVSLGAIRILLRFISTHNFRPFGIYRIVVGLVIIALVIMHVL